jgi:hypothetical protein
LTHAAGEIRITRASHTRHLSSAGFRYPLDDLRPRQPCRLCFAPTAPMGFCPSELSPATRFAGIPADLRPACRYRGFALVDRRPTRANPKPDFRVLPQSNSLQRDGCLVRCTAGCSPGFFPFQGFSRCRLDRRFRPSPLPRLSTSMVTQPASSRPRVSIGDHLVRPGRPDTPLRVLRLNNPGTRFHKPPGYGFTLRAVACCHAARLALWKPANLPELSGLLIGAG